MTFGFADNGPFSNTQPIKKFKFCRNNPIRLPSPSDFRINETQSFISLDTCHLLKKRLSDLDPRWQHRNEANIYIIRYLTVNLTLRKLIFFSLQTINFIQALVFKSFRVIDTNDHVA